MCVHHPRCTATNRPTATEDRCGHDVAASMVAPIVLPPSRGYGKQLAPTPGPCGTTPVVAHTIPPRGSFGHVVVSHITAQVLALIFPDKVWSGLIAVAEDSNLRQAEKEHETAECALRFWQAWLVRRRLVGSSFGQGRCSQMSLRRSGVQATLRRYEIFKF